MGRYLESEYPVILMLSQTLRCPFSAGHTDQQCSNADRTGRGVFNGIVHYNPEKVYTFTNPFSDYPLNSVPANKELRFLRVVSEKTKIYSDLIRAAYQQAATITTYPADNSLADQLRIVARLIKERFKNRVYTVASGFIRIKTGQCQRYHYRQPCQTDERSFWYQRFQQDIN
jgi:hypothetical protein